MLYGDRIRLRAVEREDIPTFVRWFNDPEVRQYLLMYTPMGRAEEERWFEARLDAKDDFLFAIEAMSEVEDLWLHIGNVSLHQVNWKNRSAVFAIAIGEKAYWGQGYGSDAALTILRFAFDELNLNRIELEVFDSNARAIRSYEKVGFRREGTRRKAYYHAGRYQDVHIMSVLRDEFRVQPQSVESPASP